MKVVLFDIDGTLLLTDGAGRRAVFRALEDVYETSVPDGIQFDGKTDPQIVRELMQLAGLTDERIDERLHQVLDRYVGLLQAELSRFDASVALMPGVTPLLEALEAREDVMLGLLTGNVRHGAAAKLDAVGIGTSRFRIGAFGSDHEKRPELPAIARARAEALLGHAVRGDDVVVIGDTPADMGCGLGIGARAIGVATGRYSVDELRACQPVAVFKDLSDTSAVLRTIVET